jgi:hypothetical protein
VVGVVVTVVVAMVVNLTPCRCAWGFVAKFAPSTMIFGRLLVGLLAN